MEHYAGIDVSFELSSVCVVDVQGKIVKEAKIASEPEAIGDKMVRRGERSDVPSTTLHALKRIPLSGAAVSLAMSCCRPWVEISCLKVKA